MEKFPESGNALKDLLSQKRFAEILELLNGPQVEVCEALSTSEWQSGVEISLFETFAVSMDAVNELIDIGLVELSDDYQFVREYLDQNRARFDAIQHTLAANPFMLKLPEEDRLFRGMYVQQMERLAEGNSRPRYRLISEEFSVFVDNLMQNEE
jgi:hypothetical protein